ncbi:MAG: hypothetical protein R2867_29640 [Caldilineaceae bacterium]
MAMVFQSYAIFPHLNVYENGIYGWKIKGLSRDEIRRQAAVTEITELNGLEQCVPNQRAVASSAPHWPVPGHGTQGAFDEPLSNLMPNYESRCAPRSDVSSKSWALRASTLPTIRKQWSSPIRS